jgi:hypothetical protein
MVIALSILAVVAFVALASAGGHAIANGRRPRRRAARGLRAEDAVTGRREAAPSTADAISAAQHDRKRYDISGLGGF